MHGTRRERKTPAHSQDSKEDKAGFRLSPFNSLVASPATLAAQRATAVSAAAAAAAAAAASAKTVSSSSSGADAAASAPVVTEIVVSDVPYEVFELMLLWLYGVSDTLSLPVLPALLKLADQVSNPCRDGFSMLPAEPCVLVCST